MIAHCPKCRTEYTLTDEQLAMAQGQVRCGACMTVFTAIDNAQRKKVATSRFVDDGEMIQDGDDEIFEQDPFLQSLNDMDGNADIFGTIDTEKIETEKGDQHPNEDWAEELLKEFESGSDHTPQKTPQPASEKPPATMALSSDELDDLSELDELLTLKPEEQALFAKSFAEPAHDKNHLRNRIEPEPIEFQYKRKRRLGASFFFGCVIVLLTAAAVGQIAFFKFDELNKTATWRPLYSKACLLLHCTMPARIDTHKISANHLNIKPHPYLKGILIVDLILTNHATFNQPFPALELFFTNQEQAVVAGRSISPKTYLRGDIATSQQLPQRQPIHIAIEIVDPGKTASGYFIQIAPAKKIGVK